MTSQLVNLTIEIVDLLLDGLARLEQRPDRSNQFGRFSISPSARFSSNHSNPAAWPANYDTIHVAKRIAPRELNAP